jgi:hypothetical protein
VTQLKEMMTTARAMFISARECEVQATCMCASPTLEKGKGAAESTGSNVVDVLLTSPYDLGILEKNEAPASVTEAEWQLRTE